MTLSNTQNNAYDKFLSVVEASQLLKTTPKTLYAYLSNSGKYNGKPRKRLPKSVYRRIGRKILFLKDELISWVQDGAELVDYKENQEGING